VDAGADLLGFVLEPASPRAATAVLPAPDTVLTVAVWVGEAGGSDAELDQVHERAAGKVRGRDAVVLRAGRPVARVLDLPWGEDDPGHWERAAAEARDGRVMLAGGLGPENVAAAIAAVGPWAVDASSSLELSPGVKDHERIRAYVEATR
jgi:phosphoribosylanthranilate isomerase